ncbi:MAG TPA: ABC transporter substrate-binding protein [Gammaproteobacteria bacterium]|nr:ABC transporter substrate-binding protein [Gammaproteobacteria bacterium]
MPDLVSNSYFPAIAAIALDFFAKEGLEAQHQLIFPNYKAFEALRDGEVDFVAGPAHVVPRAFPEWQGAKLLAALSQGMYWLLVMRADLDVTAGDVGAVKGRTIGAAPLVELTFRHLLAENGIDLTRDKVKIVDVKRAHDRGVSFGVAAAKALEEGQIDGFWANAMGAQNAIRSGVGKVVLDVRRGVGPKAAFHYTFPALVTSDKTIAGNPDMVAAATRAVAGAQRALVNNVSLATAVGRKLFPTHEAELIADVVGRDLPYYQPAISDESLAGLVRFSQATGLLTGSPTREQMVATQFNRYLAA